MKVKQENSIDLKKEDFAFLCPLKTDDMQSIEGGYFCQECEKRVHDVSGMSQDDFQSLKQKEENICITIKKVAMASLVLGFSAQSVAQEPVTLMEKIKMSPNGSQNDNNLTKGLDKNESITLELPVENTFLGMIIDISPENLTKENNTEIEKDY